MVRFMRYKRQINEIKFYGWVENVNCEMKVKILRQISNDSEIKKSKVLDKKLELWDRVWLLK